MSAPDAVRQALPTAASPVTLHGALGAPIAAWHAVPAGDGPATDVVVLLPGYTGGKEDFAPVLDPLAAAGVEAVSLDLPGQNASPGPDDPAAYAPERLGADVVAVAGTLRARRPEAALHLVGHSFGGLVARAAVLAAPAAFDSLVLLDSGPAAIAGGRRAVIEAMEPVLAASGVAGVYEATLALARREPSWIEPPPALAQLLRTRFLATSPACLAGMGRAIRDEPDRVAELADAVRRVLVVCGAEDDAWPVAVQREMATRLGARCEVLAGAAHSPAVEAPAALVDVLTGFWRAGR